MGRALREGKEMFGEDEEYPALYLETEKQVTRKKKLRIKKKGGGPRILVKSQRH